MKEMVRSVLTQTRRDSRASLSPQRAEELRVRGGADRRLIFLIEHFERITPHPGPLPVRGSAKSALGRHFSFLSRRTCS